MPPLTVSALPTSAPSRSSMRPLTVSTEVARALRPIVMEPFETDEDSLEAC